MTKPSNIDQKAVIVDHLTDKYLLLHRDVMFANNLPFLISVAKPINLVVHRATRQNIQNAIINYTDACGYSEATAICDK